MQLTPDEVESLGRFQTQLQRPPGVLHADDLQELKSISSRHPSDQPITDMLRYALGGVRDWEGLADLLLRTPTENRTERDQLDLTQSLMMLGRYREAAEIIGPLAQTTPGNLQMTVFAAHAHYFAGDYARAAEVLDRSWEGILQARLPDAILSRGLIHFQQGNDAEARRLLELALEMNLKSTEVQIQTLNALGRVLSAMGEEDEARGHMAAATELYQRLSDEERRLLTGGAGPPSVRPGAPTPPRTSERRTDHAASINLRFENADDALGVAFTHVPTRTRDRLMPEILGGGVVIADFNRDGAPDLFFINSGALRAPERPAAAANRLLLNDGAGSFTDVTDAWNVPSLGYGMGAAAGDYDNDGWIDLFLTAYGGAEQLLRNTGSGFIDVTESAGIVSDGEWSTSAGFLDYDNDGDLDLYIARYVKYPLATAQKCYINNRHVYCTPLLFDAVSDRLLRNEGDGTFSDVSAEVGLVQLAGKGLALLIGDVDLDGDQDIYVANDSTRNFLLLNDGRGGFDESAGIAGVAYGAEGREEAGMGSDLSDVDGDGRPDLACTNFQGEATNVYLQLRPLVFSDQSHALGVGESARARLSFGIDFADFDNDGDEDLLVANGHIDDGIDDYSDSTTFAQPNTLYVNDGGGFFTDVTADAGPALQSRDVSRGLATADLDGDGRLDFIIVNNGGAAQVALNRSEGAGNAVILWLEGRTANRSAIGARLEASIGDRTITRQILGAASFLSVSDFRVHLGLGDAEAIEELTVHWPGGEPQVIRGLAAGGFYWIVQGEAPVEFTPGEQPHPPE